MMRYKNILFILVLIFGSALLYNSTIFGFTLKNIYKPQSEKRIGEEYNPISELKYWEERIRSIGSENAYQEFKQKYATAYQSEQHTTAHIFGEILYKEDGVQGLTVCDETFSFGCYHGFFGTSISQEGIDFVSKLDAVCIEEYGKYGTGCQHGIGHGILEYLGQSQLIDGLTVCEDFTTQEKERFGCTSGLFMEYNIPIIFDATHVYQKTRGLNIENPYEPCNTIVPDRFKKSCYFEIGQWWTQVFNKDYDKIGSLCSKIENIEHKRSCYLGFGTVAGPSVGYDVEETIAICDRMPDDNGKLLCRAGASWIFWAAPEYRKDAEGLCVGLTRENKIHCLQESNLIGIEGK